MAAEDVINTAYLSTLGRPADPDGLKHYSAQLKAGTPLGDILAELNLAVESGIENVEANRLASQSEADIRRQVEADVAEFMRATAAGESTAGIGRPLAISQIAAGFTAPTPEIARDLIGRSQTVGVLNSEFDKYGGYQAVKDVYNASGGTPAAQPRVDPASVQTIDLDLPTRPSVDATTSSLDMPNKQDVSDASGGASLATPSTQLERNPFFPTLQVREDVNYDQLFGAEGKSLEQGGTAPTPETINRAFETFYNRPADTAGIQGYLQSGKSMEQINADLAYQALYAPELGLAQNAQYYEAPSQAQLGYIQSLGGGTPTAEREDTFSYTPAPPLSAEEVTSIYRDQFGYDPTPQDLEYYTQVYAMSPDVRYSANPRQQTINAILAGSGLPQYEYLKTGTDLTGTQGVNYTGTPINSSQAAARGEYIDYRTTPSTPSTPSTQPAAPFGGFFGDDNFNPFDYTGIAPTPGMYRGYDPFATQRAAEINMLGNQYLGGNFEPQGMEFYSTQRSTGRSLADIAADLSASPEGQAFAQTGAPSPERAAISSNPFFAARSPTEAAETLRALDPSNQGIVAALPGSTTSTT
jgi:hypothetical protein